MNNQREMNVSYEFDDFIRYTKLPALNYDGTKQSLAEKFGALSQSLDNKID